MLRCSICQQQSKLALCPACQSLLTKPQHSCQTCGKSLPQSQTQCGTCLHQPPAFDCFYYATRYQYPIDHWIQQLKFGEKIEMASIMAQSLIPLLPDISDKIPIIPIPLHPQRLKTRGYNQAQEIAQIIAKQQNRPLRCDLLKRHKATQMQAQLTAKQRITNVRNAFSCSSKPPPTVILLDDVLTTGQTMNAAAKALKKQGTTTIIATTFARSGKTN